MAPNEFVKAYRKSVHETGTIFGKRFGVTGPCIWQIEEGKRPRAALALAMKLGFGDLNNHIRLTSVLPDSPMADAGRKLYALRIKIGLSQKEAAAKLRVTSGAMSRAESGQRTVGHIAVLIKRLERQQNGQTIR